MLYCARRLCQLAPGLLLAMVTACDSDRPAPYEDAALGAQAEDAGDDLDATLDASAGENGDASALDGGPSSALDAMSALDAAPTGHEGGATQEREAGTEAGSEAGVEAPDSSVQVDGGPDAAGSDAGILVPEASVSDAAIPDASADARQLVAGRAHACSLDPAISGLLCWGDNRAGQARVPALLTPVFVAAGGDVTCAIERAGGVRCWGDRTHGQLNVPTLLGRATQLAVGDAHVCALTAAGVRCWGDGSAGQLSVPALSDVRAIGAGARHSCALTGAGVRCWGDDAQGQSSVPALSGVSALAVGATHNCVIAEGAVRCWGGSAPALLNPPAVSGPSLVVAGGSHSCAIDRAGVRCWGDPAARDLTPRELTWPRQLAIGGSGERAFACARHLQGVVCWGDNSLRQTEYNGAPYHLLYRAESDIQAPAALIWSILMDLPQYPQWNPYTIAMRSTLEVGDPMHMTVKMNALITIDPQTEHIRLIEPGRKICWGINTDTPALNTGERCQWLEPLPDGGTRYVTEDLIEGTLNPIVQGLFGADVQRGFEAVARALKTRAEALASP